MDSINFELAGNATSVYVNIYDSNDNLIKNMQLGAMEAGVNKIEWDGTNQDGETVEDGVYYFEAFGYDQNETYIDTVAYMESDITGVSYYDDATYLNSEDITIPLSSVFKVLGSNNIEVNE